MDKLTRVEQLRIAAFDRMVAVSPAVFANKPNLKMMLEKAEEIEKWLKAARDDA